MVDATNWSQVSSGPPVEVVRLPAPSSSTRMTCSSPLYRPLVTPTFSTKLLCETRTVAWAAASCLATSAGV